MRRLAFLLAVLALAAPGEVLTGTVVDEAGRPVAGARVRIRTEVHSVATDASGRFVLADPKAAPGREITAAHPDHVIAGATLKDGIFDYRLALPAIPPGDDPTYLWVTAFPEDDQPPRTDFGREPCGACHRRILAEWQESAHARAATNPRFVAFAAATPGPCAACHVPMAESPFADPRKAEGVAREGVGCDLCHKAARADVASVTAFGASALGLKRPPFGYMTVYGPFDDVPRGRDIFAPGFSESRFCATCHQLTLDGVPLYSEFEEWRRSPYATRGVTCQSCHMQGDGKATKAADLGPGQIVRDAGMLSSHRFHDSRAPDLLAKAISLRLTARLEGDSVIAEVEVANVGAGHSLPAGSPLRHALLVVAAESGDRALRLDDGPRLPGWSGIGFADRPGRAYARLPTDREGKGPAMPWRDAVAADDTRIPAGGRDRASWRFRLDGAAPARVSATLVIRRAFPGLAEAVGTDTGDIVAASKATVVRR
jgi:hypothetical protein